MVDAHYSKLFKGPEGRCARDVGENYGNLGIWPFEKGHVTVAAAPAGESGVVRGETGADGGCVDCADELARLPVAAAFDYVWLVSCLERGWTFLGWCLR